MTQTTAIGRQAEAAAAEFLKARGYKIISTNWRTRWCEIDIVASRDGVVYFVEVKYRRVSAQGGGLDYITVDKLKRMNLAARLWASTNYFDGDFELSVVEVGGVDFIVTDFVETLT